MRERAHHHQPGADLLREPEQRLDVGQRRDDVVRHGGDAGVDEQLRRPRPPSPRPARRCRRRWRRGCCATGREAARGEARDRSLRGAGCRRRRRRRPCRAVRPRLPAPAGPGRAARCRIASRVAASSLSVSNRKLASRPITVSSCASISARMLAAGRPTTSSCLAVTPRLPAAPLEQRQRSRRRACARPPATPRRARA